jgi:hypothetical protein
MLRAGRALVLDEMLSAIEHMSATAPVRVALHTGEEIETTGVHPSTGSELLLIEAGPFEPDEELLDFVRAVAERKFATLRDARSEHGKRLIGRFDS